MDWVIRLVTFIELIFDINSGLPTNKPTGSFLNLLLLPPGTLWPRPIVFNISPRHIRQPSLPIIAILTLILTPQNTHTCLGTSPYLHTIIFEIPILILHPLAKVSETSCIFFGRKLIKLLVHIWWLPPLIILIKIWIITTLIIITNIVARFVYVIWNLRILVLVVAWRLETWIVVSFLRLVVLLRRSFYWWLPDNFVIMLLLLDDLVWVKFACGFLIILVVRLLLLIVFLWLNTDYSNWW